MIYAAKVRECDITQEEYPEKVDGGHAIAQGATGRWCVVLYIGPAEVARQRAIPGNKIWDVDELREHIESTGGGYVDF